MTKQEARTIVDNPRIRNPRRLRAAAEAMLATAPQDWETAARLVSRAERAEQRRER
jgi:hypothetical protein